MEWINLQLNENWQFTGMGLFYFANYTINQIV